MSPITFPMLWGCAIIASVRASSDRTDVRYVYKLFILLGYMPKFIAFRKRQKIDILNNLSISITVKNSFCSSRNNSCYLRRILSIHKR